MGFLDRNVESRISENIPRHSHPLDSGEKGKPFISRKSPTRPRADLPNANPRNAGFPGVGSPSGVGGQSLDQSDGTDDAEELGEGIAVVSITTTITICKEVRGSRRSRPPSFVCICSRVSRESVAKQGVYGVTRYGGRQLTRSWEDRGNQSRCNSRSVGTSINRGLPSPYPRITDGTHSITQALYHIPEIVGILGFVPLASSGLPGGLWFLFWGVLRVADRASSQGIGPNGMILETWGMGNSECSQYTNRTRCNQDVSRGCLLPDHD